MLRVEIAHGDSEVLVSGNSYKWKVMAEGVVIFRDSRLKTARRFARTTRKLFAKMGGDDAKAAAVLAAQQMHDDLDDWEMFPEDLDDGEPEPDWGTVLGCNCHDCIR